MAVAGSLHWGSFYEWERRIGNKFLAPYFYLHLEKAWEHLLPVIALELDARHRAQMKVELDDRLELPLAPLELVPVSLGGERPDGPEGEGTVATMR